MHPGAIGENRIFGHELWAFFSAMSHTSHIKRAPEKQFPTPNLTFFKIKTMRFWFFPKKNFFLVFNFFDLFFYGE